MEHHVPLRILCLFTRGDSVHDCSTTFHLWRLRFHTYRTRFSATSSKFHWWRLRYHTDVLSFHGYRLMFILKDRYFKCGTPDYMLLEPGCMHRDWNSTIECQISCLEIEIYMWYARYDAWEYVSHLLQSQDLWLKHQFPWLEFWTTNISSHVLCFVVCRFLTLKFGFSV